MSYHVSNIFLQYPIHTMAPLYGLVLACLHIINNMAEISTVEFGGSGIRVRGWLWLGQNKI